MKKFEDAFTSERARITLGVVGALILAFLIFHAGFEIGERHAAFDRYGSAPDFQHPFLPPGVSLPHEFAPDSHGAVGTIRTIALPSLTIETPDGQTQEVLVSSSTKIDGVSVGSASPFTIGSQVVVLGEPDSQNRIDAKFVRIISFATTTP